jgi:hypothetical protein
MRELRYFNNVPCHLNCVAHRHQFTSKATEPIMTPPNSSLEETRPHHDRLRDPFSNTVRIHRRISSAARSVAWLSLVVLILLLMPTRAAAQRTNLTTTQEINQRWEQTQQEINQRLEETDQINHQLNQANAKLLYPLAAGWTLTACPPSDPLVPMISCAAGPEGSYLLLSAIPPISTDDLRAFFSLRRGMAQPQLQPKVSTSLMWQSTYRLVGDVRYVRDYNVFDLTIIGQRETSNGFLFQFIVPDEVRYRKHLPAVMAMFEDTHYNYVRIQQLESNLRIAQFALRLSVIKSQMAATNSNQSELYKTTEESHAPTLSRADEAKDRSIAPTTWPAELYPGLYPSTKENQPELYERIMNNHQKAADTAAREKEERVKAQEKYWKEQEKKEMDRRSRRPYD